MMMPGSRQPRLLSARELAERGMTEAQLQREVLARLAESGWLAVHVRRLQGRDGRWMTGTSSPGFPDVVAVHPTRGQALVLELKAAGGSPTPEQRRWVEAFAGVAGVTAMVMRPQDYDHVLGIIRGAGAAV